MSNSDEAKVLRAIKSDDMKYVVSKAFDAGWRSRQVTNGSGHAVIIWPATRGTVRVSTTPSDYRTVKNTAAEIRRVSGVRVFPLNKHGHTRHSENQGKGHAAYIGTHATDTQVAVQHQIDRLVHEHQRLTMEFVILSRGGGELTRDEIAEAKKIMKRVFEIEDAFKTFHQPIPEFNIRTSA